MEGLGYRRACAADSESTRAAGALPGEFPRRAAFGAIAWLDFRLLLSKENKAKRETREKKRE